MISVIIPTYNRAKSTVQAIQSVLRQSYQNFEIIVVDDASNDDTEARVKALADARIRYVVHSNNQGASAARNTGIIEAKGELIAFLDSDDEWLEDKLARQLEFINSAPTDVWVSCTGYILNLLDDNQKIQRTLEEHHDINKAIYYGCDISPGSTMLLKKSIFEKVGMFDTKLQRLEDWDWLLRYREVGKIALLKECLTIVNNKRGKGGQMLEQSISLFIAKHQATFNTLGFLRKREVMANIWLQAVGTYRREKQYANFFKTLLKAHVFDPFTLIKYIHKRSA